MKIKLELSQEEIGIVLASLAKQPLEIVADLFFKLKATAEQQIKEETAK